MTTIALAIQADIGLVGHGNDVHITLILCHDLQRVLQRLMPMDNLVSISIFLPYPMKQAKSISMVSLQMLPIHLMVKVW
jgi:hypothetical protein